MAAEVCASDADRERAVRDLGVHAVAGRLALREYDLRVGRAVRARTLASLRALRADLPDLSAPLPPLILRRVFAVVGLSVAVLASIFALDVAGGIAGLVHALTGR